MLNVFHMDKDQVAEVLVSIGTLLELKGENPFKTRAYFNAARAIESTSEPLATLVANNKLSEIKGVGEAIQKKVTELVNTGKLAYYEDLKTSVPAGLLAMMEIPGVGPKKIKVLYDELKIHTVEELEKACQDGRVAGLKGFGEKTALNICEGINRRRSYASKHHLDDALMAAEAVLDDLRAHPDVIRSSEVGSLRRRKEIIGDVDLLVSSKNPASVIDFFTKRPGNLNVIAKGETKASVLLAGGIQSDLR